MQNRKDGYRNMLQGFTRATTTLTPRLIVSVQGMDKHGKSSFALSAPGPIIYFNFDFGLEGVVHKYAKNKEIYVKDYKVRKGESIDRYETALVAFKQDFYNALKTTAKSIVFDTATELWELLRLARFGRLAQVLPHNYAPVNAEYIQLIREAYDNDKNLILLHKLKKEYVNDKFNGKYELAGYNGTSGLVQVNIRVYRDGLDGAFYIEVINCRQNALIGGMECPLADVHSAFPMLAQWVFPDTVEEDWT